MLLLVHIIVTCSVTHLVSKSENGDELNDQLFCVKIWDVEACIPSGSCTSKWVCADHPSFWQAHMHDGFHIHLTL